MHSEVKKCADAGDVKGLRYIFVDCLDVDPTFEKYIEDYEYCKNLEGLFEKHMELTPITMNQNMWNNNYWEKMKIDLLKNFSRERFEHMKEVAKIVYAEKIKRILKERENARIQVKEKKEVKYDTFNKNVMSDNSFTGSQKQNESLEKKKRQLEIEHNQHVAREKADKERREKLKTQERQEKQQLVKENSDSKKLMGVVVGIVLLILIVVMLIKLI